MSSSAPIPGRSQIYAKVKELQSVGFLELARRWSLSKAQGEAVRGRLDAMVADGQLAYSAKDDAYRAEGRLREVRGRVNAAGEVVGDDGEKLTLKRRLARGVLPGDKVLMTLSADGLPASLDIEHRDCEIAGTFYAPAQLIPLRESGVETIHLVGAKKADLCDGDVVVAHLTTPESRRGIPQGRLARSLGPRGDAEADVVLAQFGVPLDWPKATLNESRKLDHKSASSCVAREDLRKLDFVTIDGETARDFDDAVHCEPHGKGWIVRVAIADVAAYVRPGSALDAEAERRGNSVYMPRRVVPMLPETLSNGVCSLKPDVDRLALVCTMALSADGEIEGHDFCAATIRSSARLTYTQVGGFFANGRLGGASAPVKKSLRGAHDAFRELLKRRAARGALEIQSTETLVLFDKSDKVADVVPVARNDAHRLIEEFMICANVCAAKHLGAKKMRFLSRVHTGYKDDAFENLQRFLDKRGVRLRQRDHKALARALGNVADPDQLRAVEGVLLASIARAEYRPEHVGHFGLGLTHYAHFTSPIRRYPDLLVHRALHALLKSEAGARYDQGRLKSLGEHCGMTEKRADSASRDLQRHYECVFMQAHLGERLSGRVVGVQSFGLFVRLDKFPVEGMVHVTALPNDYYEYDAEEWSLTGRASGRVYEIGTRIQIEVARVDPVERHVDFTLPSVTPRRRGRRRR